MMRLGLLSVVIVGCMTPTPLATATATGTSNCQVMGTFNPCMVYGPIVHLTPTQNAAIMAEFARVNVLVMTKLAAGLSVANCAAATATAKANNRFDLADYVGRVCSTPR